MSLARVDPKIIEELREPRETVAIGGERKAQRSEKDVVFHCQEVTDGSFERTFTLHGGLDTDPWNAGYRTGVLELTAPVAGRWAARPHSSEHRTEVQANRGLRACFRRRTLFRPAQLRPSPPAARKTRLYYARLCRRSDLALPKKNRAGDGLEACSQ